MQARFDDFLFLPAHQTSYRAGADDLRAMNFS